MVEAGGSAAAIRHHYDVGNDFYAAWLDPGMAYSCAMWDGLDRDARLAEAQAAKLRHHARAAGARPGGRYLDIGCGWGAQMRTIMEEFGAAACVGLTLSDAQAAHVAATAPAGVSVRVENWHDHVPDGPFDGIVSVGAFEHFAHPDQSDDERRALYRRFFERCAEWTGGRGPLSLQTIAYGSMTRGEANPFITGEIFPAAELPTIADIAAAAEGVMRIAWLRDDGLDYARTCDIWARRLKVAAAEGRAGADAALVDRWHRYLRLSAAGFAMRRIVLLRLILLPWGARGA